VYQKHNAVLYAASGHVPQW